MQTVAVDVAGDCSISQAVCVNTAERIEVLLGVETIGDLRKHVGLLYNNNGFVCIAARMLDYRISATQDSAYNITH